MIPVILFDLRALDKALIGQDRLLQSSEELACDTESEAQKCIKPAAFPSKESIYPSSIQYLSIYQASVQEPALDSHPPGSKLLSLATTPVESPL